MSIRPEILQPAPGDPGSAMSIADMQRRVAILEGQYGVFGDNMRVTGATIETSDPTDVASGRVYLDGTSDPPGLFVEDSAGHNVIELTGGTTPGITAYDDTGEATFVLQGGAAPIFYQTDPTFGPTVWIVPLGGVGLLAGEGGGNTVSWHQSLLEGMDSFVQGYSVGSSNVWHAHVDTPGGGGGTDLTLYADDSGSANALELWSGPGTNSRIFFISPGGVGTIASDFNVKGTCYITGTMSAIGNSICWNDLTVYGNCTVGSLLVSSDERLKSNPVKVSEDLTLEHLEVVGYTHKVTGRQHFGLIAQEVAKHVPEVAISHDHPTRPEDLRNMEPAWSIDLYSLVSLILVEVQRLNKRVTALGG